jgi:hypothetical protein
LDTGEYVNVTMLHRRVAQIYVSTDTRTQETPTTGTCLR